MVPAAAARRHVRGRSRTCGVMPTPRPGGQCLKQTYSDRPGPKLLGHSKNKSGSTVSMSEGLQFLTNLVSAGSMGAFLYDFPVPLVKRATAAAADATLGSSASPQMRLLLRRGLRAAVALTCLGFFTLRLASTLDLVTHLDHRLGRVLDDTNTESELVDTVYTVDTLLAQLLSPGLPLRATVALATIAALLMKLHTTTADAFTHLHAVGLEHGVMAGVLSVLDLASSGKSLVEKCQGLVKMATAADRCEGPPAAAKARARLRGRQPLTTPRTAGTSRTEPVRAAASDAAHDY